MVTGEVAGSNGSQETYWLEVFSRWESTGFSIKRFCRETNTSEGKFHYWKRKLRGEDKKENKHKNTAVLGAITKAPINFKEVSLSKAPVGAGTDHTIIELEIRKTYRLRIPTGFNTETLHRVLDVFEQRRC